MNEKQIANYKSIRNLLKPIFDVVIDSSIMNPQNILEEGAAIIVANHRSDLDPFILMVNIKRPINWLGGKYLWNIPFLGKFFDRIGAIPVSKYKSEIRKAFDSASECLLQGQLVGIFPEGWNYIAENQFNWSVGDFQTGFARIAFETKSPVIPVALLGLNEKRGIQMFTPWMRKLFDYPIELQYIKGRVIYRKLHINVGKPIPCPENADPDDKESVKNFTLKVNEIVRELYKAIPTNVIGFENVEPITAVPGLDEPLPEDIFADDIIEAIKLIRLAAMTEEFYVDKHIINKLNSHINELMKFANSDDKNLKEMAETYIDWINKILNAVENKTKVQGNFKRFLRKYS